jgi:hypothetical protein
MSTIPERNPYLRAEKSTNPGKVKLIISVTQSSVGKSTNSEME